NCRAFAFCSTIDPTSDDVDATFGKPIVIAKYPIVKRTRHLMVRRSSLPYRTATDGRPSQSGCSGPGNPVEAKTTEPGAESAAGAAAIPNNRFPQCGHDAASVETCCPHSEHAIRAITSS